ncbi:MAG: hypothetical protein ACOZCP_09305 [Pseudomonadota bacterium]
MLVRLRREYAHLVTSGSQLVLLMIGAQGESALGWAVSLALIGVISLFAWHSTLRRTRAIDDTPTSRVASAAQGYVELHGVGFALDGLALVSPLTGLPCLWYRYRVERRQDNKWVTEETAESDASFLLDDGSGRCLVDPEGAEILVRNKDTWHQGERRYTQWLLLAGDPIYALGQFDTRGTVDLQLDAKEDMKALLAEWKKKPQELRARFDVNGDGQLDLREWELARAQARREVAAAHREAHRHAELHTLGRPPGGGRLYLISNLDPNRLARRYRLWSGFHLAVFFGALAGFGWTLQAGF